MDISLDKRCARELLVALELSENQGLLSEVLKWMEIQVCFDLLSVHGKALSCLLQSCLNYCIGEY